MPELRIILLVLGVLFVAGIAAFEWWRSRGHKPAALGTRGAARVEGRDEPLEERHEPAPLVARDKRPLPEINIVREPSVVVDDVLPVIELASTSESGTRRALGISISDEVAVDLSPDTPVAPPPGAAPVPAPAARATTVDVSIASEPLEPVEQRDSDAPMAPAPFVRSPPPARTEPFLAAHVELSEVRVIDGTPPPPPRLTLAWPPENERRIVTLRVVPRAEPRFSGRALRQAFSGCGFWHGPLDIYHLPDEDGRVLLSAAALAQPGTFDPSIMDSQRFSGLNLFAVLPGPRPQAEIFEELVHAARQLAERLNGMLADQHGEELTAERIARLRQSLAGAGAT